MIGKEYSNDYDGGGGDGNDNNNKKKCFFVTLQLKCYGQRIQKEY